MKLADYLTERDGVSRGGRVLHHGPELIRLAKAAGITPRHLYQIALGNGDKNASWRTASVIEHETDGRVSAAELMPAVPVKAKRGNRMK